MWYDIEWYLWWKILNDRIVNLYNRQGYINTFLFILEGHIKLQRTKPEERNCKFIQRDKWPCEYWFELYQINVCSNRPQIFFSHSSFFTSFYSVLIGKTFDFFRMCVFPAGEICKMYNRFEKDCDKRKVNIS